MNKRQQGAKLHLLRPGLQVHISVVQRRQIEAPQMHDAIDIPDIGAERPAHLLKGGCFNQAIVEPRMLA